MALRTVTHSRGNLQCISLHLREVPYSRGIDTTDPVEVKRMLGDDVYNQWLEIDQLLVQVWESHSIRPNVTCHAPPLDNWCSLADSLLPELTKKGAIGLVE